MTERRSDGATERKNKKFPFAGRSLAPSLHRSIAIRAHNLLCLVGFEGCGYSESFVRNMAQIKTVLWSRPETKVLILDSPDSICQACPNLDAQTGCRLRSRPNEEQMRLQDQEAARRLGLEPGKTYVFAEILERIKSRIPPKDLTSICGPCPWLPSGICAKALAAL